MQYWLLSVSKKTGDRSKQTFEVRSSSHRNIYLGFMVLLPEARQYYKNHMSEKKSIDIVYLRNRMAHGIAIVCLQNNTSNITFLSYRGMLQHNKSLIQLSKYVKPLQYKLTEQN